jgi:RNA polymerase sigma-B factor
VEAAPCRDDRDALIQSFLPVAQRLASQVAPGAERREDLRQVAALALVRAIDRRDPHRPHTLGAYVATCVEGELRRHLRDRAATVRVPRAQRASPTAVTARAPLELDLLDLLAPDEDLAELSFDRALVARAARALEERERRVILLRYFADRTQAQIARELGLSQAHVSRLLARALAKMRRHLARGDALYPTAPGATLGRGGRSGRSEDTAG